MFNTNITIKDVQAVFTQEEINNLIEDIEKNKRIASEKEKQESFSDFIARSIENNKSTKKVEKNNKSTKKIENEEELQEWEAELLRQSMC